MTILIARHLNGQHKKAIYSITCIHEQWTIRNAGKKFNLLNGRTNLYVHCFFNWFHTSTYPAFKGVETFYSKIINIFLNEPYPYFHIQTGQFCKILLNYHAYNSALYHVTPEYCCIKIVTECLFKQILQCMVHKYLNFLGLEGSLWAMRMYTLRK